jgi:signal peptidase I
MEPSLHAGEFVVVNKLAYRWKAPERGDIVVFHFPLDPEKRYIKRVIGLPGDTIEARDGRIYVNGVALDEPYLAASPNYDGRWQVEEGHVFVLGDNRNNSNDSKNWGSLDMDAIIGKAVLIYWPPENLGLIPHYNLVHAEGK